MTEFSVIVPTYNRPEAVERLLIALSALDYPRDCFEVVVADDGGDADIEPIVERHRESLDVVLLQQRNTGPAGARNLAAVRSHGRYLVFTDDDCEPVPGWLRAYRMALADSPESLCGGASANALQMNPYSAATQCLADFLHERFNPSMVCGAYFAANNLCLTREAFLAIGGFDAAMRFGEDRDFCHRWSAHGGSFTYAPEALVRHTHQLNLTSFLQLHFRYGRGSGSFRQRSTAKGLPRASFNSPSWYLDLLLAGVRGQPGAKGFLLTALLALSQAATAAGVLQSRIPFIGHDGCEIAPASNSGHPPAGSRSGF